MKIVIQKEIRFLIRVAVLFDTEDRMWKCVCPCLFCNWEIRSKQAGKYHNKSHGSTPLLKLSQSEHSSCCRVGSEKGETEQTKGKERESVWERYRWGVVGVKDQNKEIWETRKGKAILSSLARKLRNCRNLENENTTSQSVFTTDIDGDALH